MGRHMVALCVQKSTFESSNVCAGKGRWEMSEWGERRKGRLVKVSPPGSESTIDTDSGVFSL